MATIMGASTPEKKTFLGGWRNKRTGLLYYNVSTQTSKCGNRGQHVSDQATQTALCVDKSTCTKREAKIQVEFLTDATDKVMEARPTLLRRISDEELHPDFDKRIAESAIKIQRFYRDYQRRRGKSNVPDITTPMEESAPYRSCDFTILNRTSPRTRGDFELLYNLLDRWRILESERAARLHSEPSRLALSGLILSKEVELLRTLDSLKTFAKLRRREKSYRKFLDELSRPIRWRSSGGGEPILVDTPRVLRAREHRDLYLLLDKYDLPTSERVGLLHRVRQVALMHSCKHSRRLIRLIEQELGLSAIDQSRLGSLRDRLKVAFLRLARDALDVGRLDRSSKRLCKHCARLLPIEKFPDGSERCNYCLYLRARREPRVVYEPYTKILRDVRRSEARIGCHTSPAFAIGPEVIYHLVNDIWHSKSAVSEGDNFDELRLVRLYKTIEWSPWNCLLLTAKEAKVHRMIDDPEEFYGPVLLQSFRTKNLQARMYFKSMLGISNSERKLG